MDVLVIKELVECKEQVGDDKPVIAIGFLM